ncbi:MAG: hypothetical protein KC561_14105 [Myxococcales bacterium]|nr:hypothetical protein [Myxococcales bacterium]
MVQPLRLALRYRPKGSPADGVPTILAESADQAAQMLSHLASLGGTYTVELIGDMTAREASALRSLIRRLRRYGVWEAQTRT